MRRLGIELLTVLGLPPVEVVGLAADLGCHNISVALSPGPINPAGYPDFNLATDTALRREMAAALRDRDVSPALGEGYLVREDADIRDLAARQLEPMLELGVRRINVVSMDPDVARTLDQFAILAELATGAGLEEIVCEFAPVLTIRDLPMALEAVRHVGRPNFRLLIDTMHLGRTGGTAADLAALDPALIGYVQLADAPLTPAEPDYMQEALSNRRTPGEGELPLFDMLAAVPRDRVVSLETPQLAKALAGQGVRDIVRHNVEAARTLLERLPAA
jgi:sugar phosphate isomerase/epimerase